MIVTGRRVRAGKANRIRIMIVADELGATGLVLAYMTDVGIFA
jgi:hypothetical protein